MNTPRDALSREAARLSGEGAGLSPGGIGTVRFLVQVPKGQGATVIERVRGVLAVINAESLAGWPPENRWRQVLPGWMLDRFSNEMSQSEAEAWLSEWRGLSPKEKQRLEREKGWALSEWLEWFDPEERVWYWWDANILSSDRVLVAIEVECWPFPWKAFAWLLESAGASHVSPEC